MSISDTFTNSAYKNAIDLATGNIKGDISLAQTGVDEAYPGVDTIVQLTNSSTDSTPDDTVAAAGAVIVAAPTAYTAHGSGGTTVTSAGATDLDTTAAALATLENEVTALVTALNARFVTLDSNISDCAGKINEILVALEAFGLTE